MEINEQHVREHTTLDDILPGFRVCICNLDGLSEDRRSQLMAFGLTVGQWVEIKQRRPAFVIQVDHTEIALEGRDAARILVGMPADGGCRHHKRHQSRRRRRLKRGFFHRHGRKGHRRFLSRLIGMEEGQDD